MLRDRSECAKWKEDRQLIHPRWWDEREVETLKRLFRKLPASCIAERLGRTPHAIWRKAYELAL
jgi:hypothetical protein